MTAEIHREVMIAAEHIKASPDVVFPHFTDPALILTWIGDRARLDPRPGGIFALDMGQVMARGAVLSVEPPYRVVFSWGILDDTLSPGASTVGLVLTPDGDDTMIVLTHRGLPAAHLDSHRAGWEHQLGRLRVPAG